MNRHLHAFPDESLSDEIFVADSPLHEQVRRTLAQHGVPPRQQASLVADLCQISASQARRKLQGSVWLFDEIQTLATYCSCSIETLTQPTQSPAAGVPQKASLMLDGKSLCCDIVMGRLLAPNEQSGVLLQAVRHDTHWLVATAVGLNQLRTQAPRYAVERLTIVMPAPANKMHIAVLDDDPIAAESLCDCFINADMHATAFTSPEDIMNTNLAVFDAFVVDFILSAGQNAKTLIEHLRSVRPHSPIALLTGHLKDGTASEDDLTTVMRNHKVLFFEKPVRPALLVAAIQNSFDRISSV
jgi:ActR/RegA family two-component response regulator